MCQAEFTISLTNFYLVFNKNFFIIYKPSELIKDKGLQKKKRNNEFSKSFELHFYNLYCVIVLKI